MLRLLVPLVGLLLLVACSSEPTTEAAPDTAAAHVSTADEHAGHDHAAHADAGDEAHTCTCDEGKAGGTVWCDACAMGFFEGSVTTDKGTVEAALTGVAADPHSDEACSCSRGKEGETVWCDVCGHGYMGGDKTDDKAAVDSALASK